MTVRIKPIKRDLSPRERQVIEMLMQGLTHREIAERISRSTKTVNSHASRVLMRLEAQTMPQAVALYLRGKE